MGSCIYIYICKNDKIDRFPNLLSVIRQQPFERRFLSTLSSRSSQC